ncbi:MAG: hypothetical protein WBE80_13030 [Methylocella sp.]
MTPKHPAGEHHHLAAAPKDLPHDWSEQRHVLGFAALTSIKTQAKRSTSDDSKTALRDPAAVRAPHPGVLRLWLAPLRSPERKRAGVSGLFRQPWKLNIYGHIREVYG